MKTFTSLFLVAVVSLFCMVPAADAGREIIYAFDADYPPHTYMEDGVPVGFDIEVLQAIVKGKDIKVTYRPMQWADAQEALKGGTVHMTSGMAKTPERMKLYAFPDLPVSDFKTTLFSTERGGVRSLRDARDASKTVATQRGSLYQKLLEKEGVKPALYETEADALIALAEGKADAFAGSEKTAWYNMTRYNLSGVFPVGTPLLASSVYYVIRKGDPELLSLINEGLHGITADGTYDTICRKWFGK